LKSGVVTTSLPIVYDKPIDFGLQKFCGSCNKCARKCPSGAMTTGPKLMFNGYEIWKSDSQKCATYRINTAGGAIGLLSRPYDQIMDPRHCVDTVYLHKV